MEFAYNGLHLTVPDSVYRPAEDSFMLADAARGLRGKVLEIGCGCGIASIACTETADSVLGVDINSDAVECAKANASRNNTSNATFIISDLFSKVEGTFGAILFNPPYLPTKENERVAGKLNRAFDGGKDGRAVLDRFLSEFDTHLQPGGTLLLVQSSLNDLEKTVSILKSLGYKAETVKEEGFFFEKLVLLKAFKRK